MKVYHISQSGNNMIFFEIHTFLYLDKKCFPNYNLNIPKMTNFCPESDEVRSKQND